jgi:hypothetical protein
MSVKEVNDRFTHCSFAGNKNVSTTCIARDIHVGYVQSSVIFVGIDV